MNFFHWLFRKKKEITPISKEFLPPELHYLIPLAEIHGSPARVSNFDQEKNRHVDYAETLSKEEIASLRKLYIEIGNKQHAPFICQWYESGKADGKSPRETTWSIYGLLILFNQLGELGIEPFDDETVRPVELEVKLDWSKLPEKLRYLADPAAKYGKYQFDNRIIDYLQEQMTPEEKTELVALKQRFQTDDDDINRWLDEFNMTQHREASLVYFTGYLLTLGSDMQLL